MTTPDNPPRTGKPLGQKCYGSIPHLPGSRRGPADKGLSEDQARICLTKTRDRHDIIIVLEKLDGTNVGVAKINGAIVPLVRAGYPAISSKWEQHRHFANWVLGRQDRFDALLTEGERCCGEWLMQAHGTRYNLTHEPFVIFDIMRVAERATFDSVAPRCRACEFVVPHVVHWGGACSIEEAMAGLGRGRHGAIDPVEGAVWRVERRGEVDFLGKYVRPEKRDGCYLPEMSGAPAVWNWQPSEP